MKEIINHNVTGWIVNNPITIAKGLMFRKKN